MTALSSGRRAEEGHTHRRPLLRPAQSHPPCQSEARVEAAETVRRMKGAKALPFLTVASLGGELPYAAPRPRFALAPARASAPQRPLVLLRSRSLRADSARGRKRRALGGGRSQGPCGHGRCHSAGYQGAPPTAKPPTLSCSPLIPHSTHALVSTAVVFGDIGATRVDG